jgi:hypothetical protein
MDPYPEPAESNLRIPFLGNPYHYLPHAIRQAPPRRTFSWDFPNKVLYTFSHPLSPFGVSKGSPIISIFVYYLSI